MKKQKEWFDFFKELKSTFEIIILFFLFFLSFFVEKLNATELKKLVKNEVIEIKTEQGYMIDADILYDLQGRILKEVRKYKSGDIIESFEFKEHDKWKRPKKAVIKDYNGIEKGSIEFKYDKKGRVKNAVYKDMEGKEVTKSLFKSSLGIYTEIVKGKENKTLKLREYKIDEKDAEINKKYDFSFKDKITKQGKEFIREVKYDENGIVKEETLINENNEIDRKYIFKRYDRMGKPLVAEVTDKSGIIKGYFEFEYDNTGEIKNAIQYDKNYKKIKFSEIAKKGEKYEEKIYLMDENKSTIQKYEIKEVIYIN